MIAGKYTVAGSRTTSGPGFYSVTTPGITLTLETFNHWSDLSQEIVVKDATGNDSPSITVAAPNVLNGAIDGLPSVSLNAPNGCLVFKPNSQGITWASVNSNFGVANGLAGNLVIFGANGILADAGLKPVKNYVGTVPPGATDDSTKGFQIGSIGSTGSVQYTCLDASPSAAVWIASNTLSIPTYVGTVAPPLTADATNGYARGSAGLNYVTGHSYVAVDVSTGAAVWKLSGSLANQRAATWYIPRGHEKNVPGSALTSVLMGLSPFIVDKTMTVSQVASRITTAGTSTYQLAIYASDPTTGLPTGPSLAHTPDILSTAVADSFGVLTAAIRLFPGLYYVAVEVADNTTIFAGPDTGLLAMSVGNASPFFLTGGIASNSANGLTTPSTYATFPDLTSATFTFKNNGNVSAMVMMLVASVP